MKFIAIFILLTILVLTACSKQPVDPNVPLDPVMPPLTHQGLNTFGCYIEFIGDSMAGGKELFVANKGESMWSLPPLNGTFDEASFELKLQANRELHRDSENVKTDDISFSLIVSEGQSIYSMHFETNHYLAYSSFGLDRCPYYHDLSNRGTCEITYLDVENNIIAGSFYMTLINTSCMSGDTLMKITDGRFDFHY